MNLDNAINPSPEMAKKISIALSANRMMSRYPESFNDVSMIDLMNVYGDEIITVEDGETGANYINYIITLCDAYVKGGWKA